MKCPAATPTWEVQVRSRPCRPEVSCCHSYVGGPGGVHDLVGLKCPAATPMWEVQVRSRSCRP